MCHLWFWRVVVRCRRFRLHTLRSLACFIDTVVVIRGPTAVQRLAAIGFILRAFGCRVDVRGLWRRFNSASLGLSFIFSSTSALPAVRLCAIRHIIGFDFGVARQAVKACCNRWTTMPTSGRFLAL